MAKALIAAVALAVVLVAAVVVPLLVLPGSSGFDQWPTHTPQAPHEQVVDLSVPAAPSVRAQATRPRPIAPRTVAPHRQLAQATPRPAPRTAVTPAPQQQPMPKLPATPPQPQAAPEAPLPDPVVDARPAGEDAPHATGGEVQTSVASDGTNLR